MFILFLLLLLSFLCSTKQGALNDLRAHFYHQNSHCHWKYRYRNVCVELHQIKEILSSYTNNVENIFLKILLRKKFSKFLFTSVWSSHCEPSLQRIKQKQFIVIVFIHNQLNWPFMSDRDRESEEERENKKKMHPYKCSPDLIGLNLPIFKVEH